MGWADRHIENLSNGEVVKFRPKGNSMHGLIASGQLVTVEPITEFTRIGYKTVVLCKVKGNQYLHKVLARSSGRYLIGNNNGFTNGWTSTIYGIVTNIE